MSLTYCTGSGTQADPYIFNSWDGFAECRTQDNAYCEYDDTIPAEDRVWDMNNIKPEGVNYISLGTSVNIDFKNLKILNLRFNSGYASESSRPAIVSLHSGVSNQCVLSNLYLLNCICSSNIKTFAKATGSDAYIQFRTCVISTFSLNGNDFIFNDENNRISFKNCSINFKLNTIQSCYFYSSYGSVASINYRFDSCKIKLNVSGRGNFYIFKSYPLGCRNVKFYGKSSAPTQLAVSVNNQYSYAECVVYDLVCTLDAAQLSSAGYVCVKDRISGLLNSDKVTFTNVPSGVDMASAMLTNYNINLLTSSQMIDMDYLDNIGFPVLRAGT